MNTRTSKLANQGRTLGESALVESASAPYLPSKATKNGAVLFSIVLAAAVLAALLLVAWFGLGLMNPWVPP